MNIGIVVIATNAYFILGLRFIQKFKKYYTGNSKITFYFFSDTDPKDYTDIENVIYFKTYHNNWQDGTNSKFKNILETKADADYLYYFDSDTNVERDFDESWFIGDMVGGEHYANRDVMKDKKAYDRNPKSEAYIPYETSLEQIYYYGAFFGGKTSNVMKFAQLMTEWQAKDRSIGYEPAVNDESYINRYFHYYKPKVVPSDQFAFLISDKGGLGDTRFVTLDIEDKKKIIKENKGKDFDLKNNQLIYD